MHVNEQILFLNDCISSELYPSMQLVLISQVNNHSGVQYNHEQSQSKQLKQFTVNTVRIEQTQHLHDFLCSPCTIETLIYLASNVCET